MDDTKDIKQTTHPNRLIEQDNTRTNPFGENRAAERTYRRAERIVAGIYLLTNHVPATEPIRTKMRENSADLLAQALQLRDEMRTENSPHVVKFIATIRHLISLARVMSVAGFASSANASVIADALDELGGFVVSSQRSILSENIVLSREDLTDVRPNNFRVPTTRVVKDTSNTDADVVTTSQSDSDDKSVVQKDSIGKLSSRVQNILEILKVGGSLGIKDISSNLPEYSEKMIQRELLELVSRGAVKKTGLKRWSKYSLAA